MPTLEEISSNSIDKVSEVHVMTTIKSSATRGIMATEKLSSIEEGEEEVDYVEAYKNNISDVQNYLQSVLGEENPHAVFNADHLEDLFAAVHTNDFWDDLFSAKPGDVTNKDMPDPSVQSLAADLSSIALSPDSLESEVPETPQTDIHMPPVIEQITAVKLLSQELEQLRESWTEVAACKKVEIASISPLAVDQVGVFVQEPQFWQELVQMHLEVSTIAGNDGYKDLYIVHCVTNMT